MRTEFPGQLIVLAAPSGAGKTTLVHKLLERDPNIVFSVSYTTRKPRRQEVPGTDYFFVSEDEFRVMRDRNEFLEYAEVFDHWYGTSNDYVQSILDGGHSVLLEIDWQGAQQVRQRRADAISIFIMPPSCEELERRLRGRQTDSEAVIKRRLDDALSDMTHWKEFDYVVINSDVETAVAELEEIISVRDGPNRTSSPEIVAAVAKILGASA